MRRLVVALVMVMVATSLAGCAAPVTSSQAPPVAVATATVAVPVSSDKLSPTQTVLPGERVPADAGVAPQVILDKIAAKQPMLLFWYDPTTQVAAGQRAEIDAVMKKYRGMIELVTFDYTAGLPAVDPATGKPSAVPSETAKAEMWTASMRVNTTPYIVLVDRYGRVVYRFAGFVDRGLLERETIRATQ